MQCCVPFCENSSKNISESQEITSLLFPSEPSCRVAWFRALGIQEHEVPEHAVVCDQHYHTEDLYETQSGERRMRAGAVPLAVQVCTMCLDTDSKLYILSKYKLEEAYENLTGLSLEESGNMVQAVCAECAHRLISCRKLREKSLRAHSLMMELVKKHLLTIQNIKMINREQNKLTSNLVMKMFDLNHFDLNIVQKTEHVIEDSTALGNDVRLDDVKVEKEECYDFLIHAEDVTTEEINDNCFINANTCDTYAKNTKMINSDDTNLTFNLDTEAYEPNKFDLTIVEETENVNIVIEDLAVLGNAVDDIKVEKEECYDFLIHAEDVSTEETNDNCFINDKTCDIYSKNIKTINSDSKNLTFNLATDMCETNKFGLNIIEGTENVNIVIEDIRTLENTEYPEVKVKKEECDDLLNDSEDVSSAETNRNNFNDDNIRDNHADYIVLKKYLSDECPHLGVKDLDDAVLINSDIVDVNCVPKLESQKGDNSVWQQTYQTLNKHNANSQHTFCDTSEKINKKRKAETDMKNYSVTSAFELMNDRKIALDKLVMKKLMMKQHKTRQDLMELEVEEGNINKTNVLTEETALLVPKERNIHSTNTKRKDLLEKKFTCNICNYKTSRRKTMDNHLLLHNDKANNIFVCTYCGYITKNQSNFIVHVKIHTGVKPFSCDQCPYKCTSKQRLNNHMKTHTGVRPFACKHCPYKSINKDNLITHIMTHTGEKPFLCKHCPYKCIRKSHLIRHMRTHTGEKPFTCDHCPYRCLDQSNYIRHVRTHTDEKHFSCDRCQYKCFERTNYMRHMRTHSGDKLFSCQHCAYKCVDKRNYMRHMKTHGHERPFVCKQCPYKCIQKGNLIRHMRTHV